ncbi:MAG: hypothetical protein QM831_46465 [Kofleriaceae bacterium]
MTRSNPADATDQDCQGGPTYTSSAHGGLVQANPDKVYPPGCAYHADECGCCYSDGRIFFCERGSYWEEPI